MYAQHMPLISEYGRTPAGFAAVVSFAIATQNQRFYLIKRIMECARSDGVFACTQLSRRQKNGVLYAQVHAGAYLLRLSDDTVDALRLLVELPSIGIVKAAFVLQMLGYPVGCLDVHNTRLAGLPPRMFQRVPTSVKAFDTCIQKYLDTCTRLGGAALLWDRWCTLIACKYSRWFTNTETVSAYHVSCIMGERDEEKCVCSIAG